MPAPRKVLDSDNIVNAYRAGGSLTALAKERGVHRRTIQAILADAGVTLRTKAEAIALTKGVFHRTDIDPAAVVRAYVAGHGKKALADLHGCDQGVIDRILRAHGVPVRGGSAAKRAKYDLLGHHGSRWREDLDIEEIAAKYVAGASSDDLAQEYGVSYDTIRRRLRPLGIMRRAGEATNRDKVARGMERGERRTGRFEVELAEALTLRGLDVVRQMAVGSRNIDVAASPVAVEVWLSSLRPDNDAYCRERIVDLADAGWHVAYVHIARRTQTLTAAVTDKLVAWVESAKANPAARREYRVIRGTGELVSRGHVYPERRPLVPAPVDGADAV